VLALDLETGAILWKTYTVPAGYAGGSVWGSTPVVDVKRHSLYLATGNNYAVPPEVAACISAAGSDPVAANACLAPDDYLDAIVALDLRTGAIKWGHRLQGVDVWTVACVFLSCPVATSPDYDFGAGPNLFTVDRGRQKRELLGAGQKSGMYWALDPDTGKIVWATSVGPGSKLGGVEWGTASDGQRIYAAISNFDRQSYTLRPSGQTITWGAFSALDAATGQILWQTADPLGSFPLGPVTVANGVVYAESLAAQGPLYAFSAATGRLLWSFHSTGSAMGGAAVVNGTVYWGAGYPTGRIGVPDFVSGNHQLFAFGLPYP
jgi:polyvinyl alcohol dehydrogenase (cytochrome)